MSPVFSWMTARMKYLLPVLAFLGIAVPAAAQGPGVRGGVSIDPDQVYFGGHYETDALVDRLHFRPNLEVGIGDDVVATTINLEFVYKFPSARAGCSTRAAVPRSTSTPTTMTGRRRRHEHRRRH